MKPRHYIPRCTHRACGALSMPVSFDQAVKIIEQHHSQHPSHKTVCMPTVQSITVKGVNK